MNSHLIFKNFIFAFFTILVMIGFAGNVSADQANPNTSSNDPSQVVVDTSAPSNKPKPNCDFSTNQATPNFSSSASQKLNPNVNSTNDSSTNKSGEVITSPSKTDNIKVVQSSSAKVEVNSTTTSDEPTDTSDNSQVKVATVTKSSTSSNSSTNGQSQNKVTNSDDKGTKTVKLTTPTKAKNVIDKSSFRDALLPKTGSTKINLSMDLLLCGGLASLIYIPAVIIFNTLFN